MKLRIAWAALASSIVWLMACSQASPDGSVSGALNPEPPGLSREQVQDVLRDARVIQTPRGIEELKSVEIGGIPQWLSVRGQDRRNPILLFIHGGPGTTEMPVSWFYQRPLEDYFTVVQWDQRGSGKTAAANDPAAVIPAITVERMIEDSEEVVAYLRQQYGKDRIFVLGHSWGSLLGLELARRHPDWLHAYIGMGQFIHTLGNEAVGYRFAVEEARRRNDVAATQELEAIAPYPGESGELIVQDVIVQRKWVSAYGGMAWGRQDLAFEDNLRQLSPEYTSSDLEMDSEIGNVVMQLLPQLSGVDYRGTTELDVPVFLFSGRYDYAVPSEVSQAWFEALSAPRKELVWFEHSAHMMHIEQPGKFLMHLVNDVRPIAAEAGDAAPPDAPGIAP